MDPSWTRLAPKRAKHRFFLRNRKKRVKFKTIFWDSQATSAGYAVAAGGLKSLNEVALASQSKRLTRPGPEGGRIENAYAKTAAPGDCGADA